MRVRCVKVVNSRGDELADNSSIGRGREYTVLSIAGSPSSGVTFRIHGDDDRQPYIYRADMFEVVRSELPSTWRCAIGTPNAPGYVQLAPEPWLRPGFWDDYWDEQLPEAIDIFRAEAQKILLEDGAA